MSEMSVHPAPHRGRVSFWALMFGCCAAPIFWLGQLILGYAVSAQACYGGDHPATIAATGALRATLIAFDAVAIVAAIAGALVSLTSWRATRDEMKGGHDVTILTGEGRARFMALWGIYSSLCFLIGIVFNIIASVTVPLCVL